MKMIYAIVRPEKVYEVNKALADAGYGASTKWSVAGRGKQHGIQVGELVYDEMSKNMLMIVCDDDDKNEIIDIFVMYLMLFRRIEYCKHERFIF